MNLDERINYLEHKQRQTINHCWIYSTIQYNILQLNKFQSPEGRRTNVWTILRSADNRGMAGNSYSIWVSDIDKRNDKEVTNLHWVQYCIVEEYTRRVTSNKGGERANWSASERMCERATSRTRVPRQASLICERLESVGKGRE